MWRPMWVEVTLQLYHVRSNGPTLRRPLATVRKNAHAGSSVGIWSAKFFSSHWRYSAYEHRRTQLSGQDDRREAERRAGGGRKQSHDQETLRFGKGRGDRRKTAAR